MTLLEKDPANCYDVWISGKKVKLQRGGILPLEGVIGPPTAALTWRRPALRGLRRVSRGCGAVERGVR